MSINSCNTKIKLMTKLLTLLHNKRVGLLIDIDENCFLFIIRKQHKP